MPDITMCKNTVCTLKDKCYRFTAKPNKLRQSYFNGNYDTKTKKCSLFWNNDEYSN